MEEEICSVRCVERVQCFAAGRTLTYRVLKSGPSAYSIAVSCGQNVAICREIFPEAEKTIALCRLLAKHAVFPEHLQDIVEDILCAGDA